MPVAAEVDKGRSFQASSTGGRLRKAALGKAIGGGDISSSIE